MHRANLTKRFLNIKFVYRISQTMKSHFSTLVLLVLLVSSMIHATDLRIFVIGGENEKNQALSSVEVYDINTGEWSYGPPMKHSRRYHAAVEYQGNIYVMGGKTENDERTSSCEKLVLLVTT